MQVISNEMHRQLPVAARPESVGMSSVRLEAAAELLQSAMGTADGISAASIVVVRKGAIVLSRGFGQLAPDGSSSSSAGAVDADSVFIMASVTKPITAMALMILVEEGRLSLDDYACRYIPEFCEGERGSVTLRHLLSHTSGLPDMLPENSALRLARAPLDAFVQASMHTPLLYSPGTDWSYSSMGILLAAEIIERLSGQRLRDFEAARIFTPLSMRQTSLGLGGRSVSETVLCGDRGAKSDSPAGLPNSSYWRDMAHPWGGMHSSANDMALLLQCLLEGGRGLWCTSSIRALTSDQNAHLPGRPWGLGWATQGASYAPHNHSQAIYTPFNSVELRNLVRRES